MKREKFCEFVRVIIALPVMLVLLFVMWNAFSFYASMGMAALRVPYPQSAIGHLLALALVCYLAKPIYWWLHKALRIFIR